MILDQHFKNKTFSTFELANKQFDNCIFEQCILKDANLDHTEFLECTFISSDASNISVNQTSFKNVSFQDCKLIGVDFSIINPFLLEIDFEGCNLSLASFYDLKITNIKFSNCILHQVDFTQADLSNIHLHECQLNDAIFKQTNLQFTDFSTALSYSFLPHENKVKNAKFSQGGALGLLEGYGLKLK